MKSSRHKPNRSVGYWLIFSLASCLLTTFAGVAGNAASVELIFDGFEEAGLNSELWQVRQAPSGSYWIDGKLFHSGQRSLAIQTNPHGHACGGKCQRTEVRIAKKLQIPFGSDALYSFSFLLNSDTPIRENTRWVSGQWKQQADGSPFLAQRFEHGVFHITVQDNDCRVLVAKSAAEHIKIPSTNRSGFTTQHAFVKEKFHHNCIADIKVEESDNPTLPEPFGKWINMTYYVRGGRNGTGLVEIWANGKFIARVTGSIGYDNVLGPMQYFKFGIYRDVMPGTGIAHLDNFKREIIALDQNNAVQIGNDLAPTK